MYPQQRTPQQGFVLDTGPTVQEIDTELRDASDSLLERYAAQFDPSQIQARRWEALPIEQRQAMRAANELARRRNEKERAAKQAAEDARIEQQRDAANQAKIDAYKAQIRGAWIGDQASFDAAWPELLQRWQIEQARGAIDANTARLQGLRVEF